MHNPLHDLKFVFFIAPLTIAICFVVNLMTSPGDWWFQWVVFGVGIGWVISAFRLLRTIIVVGGLAAFIAYIARQRSSRL